MALNFPTNPSASQIYQTGSSATYRFNGRFWDVTQGSPLDIISSSFASLAITSSYAIKAQSVVVISGSQPSSQPTGSLYFNNLNNELYLRSGSAYQSTTPNKNRTYISGSQPSLTVQGDLWFDTVREKLLVNNSGSFVDAVSGSAPFKNITKVSATGYGGTILLADGRVFCIKGNDGSFATWYGAISPNSVSTGLRRSIANAYEIVFPNETAGTVIDAGTYGYSAYALFANGDLYTWGRNNWGQLGVNSTTDVYYPTFIASGIAQVYPTQGENDPELVRLIVRRSSDGAILACGYNANGELGLGNTNTITTLTALTWAGNNPLSVWNLGSWSGNIFVQRANTQIWVSGRNAQGQIGNGNETSSTSAQQVDAWLGGNGSNRIVNMFAGHREITSGDGQNFTNMMLLNDPNTGTTSIRGAGYNGFGQLGRSGTTNSNVPVSPTLVSFGDVADMATIGGATMTVYVLKRDGTFATWGYAGVGAVGSGGTTNLTQPFTITILANALDIVPVSQGIYTFPYNSTSPLVRKTDGYYTTGFNSNGQLGRGTTTNPVLTFGKMLLPDDVVIKFVGCIVTQSSVPSYIAVDTLNRIWGWGWNGQLLLDPAVGNHLFQPVQIVAEALMN